MEFGGNDVVFYLIIHVDAEWEKITKVSLTRKAEVLQYVAQETQKAQCSSC